jgi:hypothetical protein
MKSIKKIITGCTLTIAFMFSFFVFSSMAECPPADCNTMCGTSGSGCQITQYEDGKLCSTTICEGKRGAIQ